MTPLLTARRKHLAAAFGLHAHAKTVRLGAPAFARLISALWQSNPPLILRAARTGSSTAREHAPLSTQPTERSTGRLSGPIRISKCSRPSRARSRNTGLNLWGPLAHSHRPYTSRVLASVPSLFFTRIWTHLCASLLLASPAFEPGYGPPEGSSMVVGGTSR